MRRPLVHVGYHKTGSSWLQQELFNRTDRGFFPLTPEGAAGGLDSRAVARLIAFARPLEFDPSAVREKAMNGSDSSSPGCPVISHERLSGNPHAGGHDARELADRIHAAFPEAAVLIVIREQTAMILSCYYQYLRVGGACSLADYMTRRDGIRPAFSLAHFRYHLLIGHYRSLFGRDRVLVLPYEMLSREPARFVETLARFAGTDTPADLPFAARRNQGRGRLVASKTRWLNQFACRNSLNGFSPLAPERRRAPLLRTRDRLDRLVPRWVERSFVGRQRARIASLAGGYFDESNRATSELIGIDLSAFGYRTAESGADACVA